jgi:hypothetical protein
VGLISRDMDRPPEGRGALVGGSGWDWGRVNDPGLGATDGGLVRAVRWCIQLRAVWECRQAAARAYPIADQLDVGEKYEVNQ